MEFFAKNIIPGEVIVQLLAFLIVFFTLRKLAWKPILDALESRRQRIKEEFERIDSAHKDIEQLKTEYTRLIQKIEDEARSKIQEAIHEGRRIAREVQEKAREESQTTLTKAKENLDIEIAKARITMRREIAGLALQVSEKVLQEKLDKARDEEKILEIINSLEKAL